MKLEAASINNLAADMVKLLQDLEAEDVLAVALLGALVVGAVSLCIVFFCCCRMCKPA